LSRIGLIPACIPAGMATNTTLLCIHRDPAQLSLLQEHYELLTATNGHEGLRLFMSQPVDAIVLDYQLGLLDGGIVAAAIKNVKPQVPIVMLTECMDIPVAALNSVDALVAQIRPGSLPLGNRPLGSQWEGRPSRSSSKAEGGNASASAYSPRGMGRGGTPAGYPCSIGR